MRFVCEKCRTKYSIADEKVRKKVLKIRCKKCRNIIVVREPVTKAKAAAGGKKKRDRLDDEFERAFDRLTGGNKKPEQPESGVMRRTDAGLEKEFGEAASGEEWFAILRGEQVGPMTLAELQAAVQAGRVLHGTYVWRDGMDDWVRAARCPDVRHLLPEKRQPSDKPGVAKAAEKPAAEKKTTEKKAAEKKPHVAEAPPAAAGGAAFDDETKFAAAAAEPEPGPEPEPAAEEPATADVLPLRGREAAAGEEPAQDEAASGPDAAAAEATPQTAEERWEEEDRRAADLPGMPPPMPEEEDEIIIAPAVTGKLVTLRAALAMTLASSLLSIIGTAVVMAILEPEVKEAPKVEEVVKKKARKKIVLTPELLALKSKLFGEDKTAHGGKRRHPRRSSPDRSDGKPGAGDTGLVPGVVDTGGAPAAAGLEAAMARVGQSLGEDRGTRGAGEAAESGPLTGVAVDGGAGLPGTGRSSAIASSGGYGGDVGRRTGADVSGAGSQLPDGLSGEVVAARFQGRWIESCYNRALKRDPGMKGKMVVSFEIGNSGRVNELDISPRQFRGTFLAQCFSREIKKIRFPRFRGEPIPIEYPFILSAR